MFLTGLDKFHKPKTTKIQVEVIHNSPLGQGNTK